MHHSGSASILAATLLLMLIGCISDPLGVGRSTSQKEVFHIFRGDSIGAVLDTARFDLDPSFPNQVEVIQVGHGGDDRAPGPTDYELIGLIKVRRLGIHGSEPCYSLPSYYHRASFMHRDWMPEVIVAPLFDTTRTEPLAQKNAQGLGKSPFLNGCFVLLEDSVMHLSLFTQ